MGMQAWASAILWAKYYLFACIQWASGEDPGHGIFIFSTCMLSIIVLDFKQSKVIVANLICILIYLKDIGPPGGLKYHDQSYSARNMLLNLPPPESLPWLCQDIIYSGIVSDAG